jgi:hypothetical protein
MEDLFAPGECDREVEEMVHEPYPRHYANFTAFIATGQSEEPVFQTPALLDRPAIRKAFANVLTTTTSRRGSTSSLVLTPLPRSHP